MTSCNYCSATYNSELDLKFHLIEAHRRTLRDVHKIVSNG